MRPMRVKVIKLGLVAIMIVGVTWLIIWHFGCDKPGGEVESTRYIRPLLDELLDRREFEGRVVRAEEFMNRIKRREAASEWLRSQGTNVLSELMVEVRAFRKLKKMKEKSFRLSQLWRAFEVLGANASPLLPELVNEFRTHWNIGALPGIGFIGDAEGGLAIVMGLTNADWEVRFASTDTLYYCFSSNQVVAEAAIPFVIENLRHRQQGLRVASALALGEFGWNSAIVLPELMRCAEKDEDVVVRCAALKAIAKFGTNATMVKKNIEALAVGDPHRSVRQVASNALSAIDGSPVR